MSNTFNSTGTSKSGWNWLENKNKTYLENEEHLTCERKDHEDHMDSMICDKCYPEIATKNNNSLLKDDVNLRSILDKYHQLQKDNSYVYKMCADARVILDNGNVTFTRERPREWIIILQKQEDTKTCETCETRWICDRDYAQLWGDVFKVVEIFNVHDSKITRDQISDFESVFSELVTCYRKGHLVRANDYNEENYQGVQYFKTLKRAYFSRPRPDNYSGIWMKWHSDGSSKSSEIHVHKEQEKLMVVLKNMLAKHGVNLSI